MSRHPSVAWFRSRPQSALVHEQILALEWLRLRGSRGSGHRLASPLTTPLYGRFVTGRLEDLKPGVTVRGIVAGEAVTHRVRPAVDPSPLDGRVARS